MGSLGRLCGLPWAPGVSPPRKRCRIVRHWRVIPIISNVAADCAAGKQLWPFSRPSLIYNLFGVAGSPAASPTEYPSGLQMSHASSRGLRLSRGDLPDVGGTFLWAGLDQCPPSPHQFHQSSGFCCLHSGRLHVNLFFEISKPPCRKAQPSFRRVLAAL